MPHHPLRVGPNCSPQVVRRLELGHAVCLLCAALQPPLGDQHRSVRDAVRRHVDKVLLLRRRQALPRRLDPGGQSGRDRVISCIVVTTNSSSSAAAETAVGRGVVSAAAAAGGSDGSSGGGGGGSGSSSSG
jgi:hypothetical protein